MAGIIRKASPSAAVLPLALRAIGSYSTTLTRAISTSQQSKYSHSVASAEDLVDATLYKVLKHEIKSTKSKIYCSTKVYKVPDDFPFKIEVDGRRIKLERKLPDGEEVIVKIDMNAVNLKETESMTYDDKESIGSKKNVKEPAIPMTVKVYKPDEDRDEFEDEDEDEDEDKDEDNIKFEITLSKEDITIQRFTIKRKEHLSLSGPKFKEMDTVLQQWLLKYLEIRGIKTNIASYLLNYIAMENKKVDLIVLKILQNYILS